MLQCVTGKCRQPHILLIVVFRIAVLRESGNVLVLLNRLPA